MNKTVEVFTPPNRLAEKAELRDEPVEALISNAESAVAALSDEIGPQLDPEIRKLRERIGALADADSSALGELMQDARQLGEVALTLGYCDAGQILFSLQHLLAGASGEGLTPKTTELARLHVEALGRLSRDGNFVGNPQQRPHPIAGELESATRRLIETQQ